MSWAIGFDANWQRDIGYGVPATCDAPGCGAHIDRGLSYVCGNEPYGGDRGCGLYFCDKHQVGRWQRCTRCTNYRQPYKPSPDVREWIEHKLTDESWEQWRKENPKEVAELVLVMGAAPGMANPAPCEAAKRSASSGRNAQALTPPKDSP
jgi:hypothetical protein